MSWSSQDISRPMNIHSLENQIVCFKHGPIFQFVIIFNLVVISQYVGNKCAQSALTYQIILATYELNVRRTTVYCLLIYDVIFRLS